MRRDRIYVCSDNIRFYFIGCDLIQRSCMVYRVDHGKKFPSAAAVAQLSKGHRSPDSRMSILSSIFPYTRDISLYIAGIQVRFVERRVQKLDKSMVPANKKLVHCFHCHAGAFSIPGSGEYRPALRNGIDPAFSIIYRTQWRTIVKKSTQIPFAIPAVLLDISAQISSFLLTAFYEGQITVQTRDLTELYKHFIEEESQPDAFALTVFTHPVHSVIPIT